MTSPLSTKKIASKRLSRKSSASSKKHSRPLLKRVQNFAQIHSLWKKGDSLLIGISGGPDSVCLLHMLKEIAKKSDLVLFAAHINYRLRGKESDSDEQFVRALCKTMNIPLFVYKPRVFKKSENTLRTLRYNRFENLKNRLRVSAVAVGHNKNDQAETLLLHLFRGCGIRGLQGISPKRGAIIRPLLSLSRKDILSYIKDCGLSFREDASNASPEYMRNIIRNKILPYLQKKIRPNIIHILSRNCSLLSEDAHILENITIIPSKKEENTVFFNKKVFLRLDISLQRRYVQSLLSRMRQLKNSPPSGRVEEIRKAIVSQKNKNWHIFLPGLIWKKKGDTVYVEKDTNF